VALEYVLRYPGSVSHLILADTAASAYWARENAPEVMAARGFSPESVELCRRWFNGEIEPREWLGVLRKIGPAYYHRGSVWTLVRDAVSGGWRTKMRPEALMFAGQHLMKDWSVVDRLGEITVPTLVIAGASDFVFPPEAQRQLVAGLPNARLSLIEGAGHDPWVEQPRAFFAAMDDFLSTLPQAQLHAPAG
jgi:proline iminopeptidase